MIDGQMIGRFAATIPATPNVGLWLASAPNQGSPFRGAFGGLRFWDIALEPETLVEHALLDPLDSQYPHPDLSALRAYSELPSDTIHLLPLQTTPVLDTGVSQ